MIGFPAAIKIYIEPRESAAFSFDDECQFDVSHYYKTKEKLNHEPTRNSTKQDCLFVLFRVGSWLNLVPSLTSN